MKEQYYNRTGKCSMCGNFISLESGIQLENGDLICRDCKFNYITCRIPPELYTDFVKKHIGEAAQHWFGEYNGDGWVTEEERERIVLIFMRLLILIEDDNFKRFEKAFCKEHPDFYQFVEKRLGARISG